MTSNAVPPSVTPPSPNEWPQFLIVAITGVLTGITTTITAAAHGMTSTSNGVTFVGFKQVLGTIPLNGQNALVQSVIDDDNFIVNIDSTNYPAYVSGGVVIIDSMLPPVEQAGFQFFNTPFQNIATSYFG